jgi:hypothetical protein
MPEQESTRIDNKKFDENAKSTISSIDKLLSMAEESEEKILKHEKDEVFIILATAFVTVAFSLMISITPWYKITPFEVFSVVVLITLFITAISFFMLKLFEAVKNKRKEVITFNESLGVVQEILPYYFDKMSVLEKTIYKIRLSKLDIAGTEVKQENNNSSVQN